MARRRTRRRRGRRAPAAPSSPSRRRASSARSIASIRCHRAVLGPPGGHAAAEEAAHAQADRGEQLGRLELVAVGGGDDEQLGVDRHHLGDLGGEAGVVGGGADRAGDVGLVELLVGARVDRQRPCGDRRLEAVRGEPRRGADRLDQRAAVERDDVLDVGRLAADAWRPRPRRTRPRCRSASARLWRRSKPIVEEVLRSIPELPQSEPPRCPGQTSASSGSASSRSCRERKMSAAPSRGSTARSGRATSPTKSESPVSTAQGSSPRAGVAQQEGGVLGPVAGRVDRLDARALAQRQRPAVGEGLVRVLGLGQLVDVDRRAGRAGQAAVAGDVVGVVVGLEHVLDPHAVQAAEVQVGVDVPLRVDHRGDAARRCRRPDRRRSRGPRG